MEKLSYVLIKAFVSRVLVRFYFFTATHVHLAGLPFLIFSRNRRYEIFMFFFQRIKIRLLCFRQLSLYLFLLSR